MDIVEDSDLFLTLFAEWYGIAPVWSHFARVKNEAFENLWTQLWFAKGPLTAPLDARLSTKYHPAFKIVAPYIEVGVPVPPPGLRPQIAKMWLIGAMLLCDQISRNIFRNTPRAYETDKLARRIASLFLVEFDVLPVAVRVSLVLVLVHSEDPCDWGLQEGSEDTVAALLARLEKPLLNDCAFVWESLRRIAGNHRDRMHLFGRVPDRNLWLGRKSTDQEVAYLEAMQVRL